MSLISVSGLEVSRGGRKVLRNVDLAISPAEIVTVVGPNGSGKSTLLHVLVGSLRAEAGRIERRRGLKIAYAPQRLHVDETLPLSVGRFLDLPRRRPSDEAVRALARAGLPDLRDRPVTQLSGGQFQRVLVARAVLSRPDLMILDEPTQGLDQPGAAGFYRLIEDVRDELGCAVLMVSHDLHVVMSASDRVVCLNGHVCCEGAPEVVSSAPEYRALFGFGTQGALALYRHAHDHAHDESCAHDPSHEAAG